jgi:hypothetical protein
MVRPIGETAEDLRRADQLVKRGNEKAVIGVQEMNKAEAEAGAASARLKTAITDALAPYRILQQVAGEVGEGATHLRHAAQIIDSTDADIARLYDKNLRTHVSNIGNVATGTKSQADQKIKAMENLQAALDDIEQQARALFTDSKTSLDRTRDGLDALSHALQTKAGQLEAVLRGRG